MAIEKEYKESGVNPFLRLLLILGIVVLIMATGVSSFLLIDFFKDTYLVERENKSMEVGLAIEPIEEMNTEEHLIGEITQNDMYRMSNGLNVKTTQEIAKLKSEVVRIETATSQGSGVIINEKGYIITNWHVVQDAKEINVFFQNNYKQGFLAEIMQYDQGTDLALIRIHDRPQDIEIEPIPFGDSTKVEVGERVITIGSPRGLMNTVAEGIVSGIRDVDQVSYIQITAPLSPGSSGGALINSRGELIGINTFKVIESENINFAISTETVIGFLRGYVAKE